VLPLCCPRALDVRFAVFAVEYQSTEDTLILLPIASRGRQTLPSSFPKRMRDVNRCSEWQTSVGGPSFKHRRCIIPIGVPFLDPSPCLSATPSALLPELGCRRAPPARASIQSIHKSSCQLGPTRTSPTSFPIQTFLANCSTAPTLHSSASIDRCETAIVNR